MKYVTVSCLILASMLGCQKKEDKPLAPAVVSAVAPPTASVTIVTPETAAASASAAPLPSAAAAASEGAAKIPVQEDFEKQAKATVTKPTLKQEIDKLEKEIGK